MAVSAAPVRPVRTPRAMREVQDSVEVLYARVLEVANQFQKESDQSRARKWGQSIVELQSGDTQPNRRAMFALLKETREWVAYEDAQVAKKAQALTREVAVKVEARATRSLALDAVMIEWNEAKDAWIKWVVAEKVAGHEQALIAMEAAFNTKFLDLWIRIEAVKVDDYEAKLTLIGDLVSLTFEVRNFVQNYCKKCGAPIENLITPKNGNKPFKPEFCRNDVPVKKSAATETEYVSTKKASKPGNKIDPNFVPRAREQVKAAKRARQLQIQAKRAQEDAELQSLRPGQNRDGAAKKAKDQAKEARKQGGHPEGKKSKKGGKKKGASKGE